MFLQGFFMFFTKNTSKKMLSFVVGFFCLSYNVDFVKLYPYGIDKKHETNKINNEKIVVYF